MAVTSSRFCEAGIHNEGCWVLVPPMPGVVKASRTNNWMMAKPWNYRPTKKLFWNEGRAWNDCQQRLIVPRVDFMAVVIRYMMVCFHLPAYRWSKTGPCLIILSKRSPWNGTLNIHFSQNGVKGQGKYNQGLPRWNVMLACKCYKLMDQLNHLFIQLEGAEREPFNKMPIWNDLLLDRWGLPEPARPSVHLNFTFVFKMWVLDWSILVISSRSRRHTIF